MGQGGNWPSRQILGKSVNPIPDMGADYTHHITASPPGFENPAASLIQNSKFNNLLWVCWFLSKIFLKLSPAWKLHNPYCHNPHKHLNLFSFYRQKTRADRMVAALTSIGPAVFNGGISTLIAIIMLISSQSHVFISYFKVSFVNIFFPILIVIKPNYFKKQHSSSSNLLT